MIKNRTLSTILLIGIITRGNAADKSASSSITLEPQFKQGTTAIKPKKKHHPRRRITPKQQEKSESKEPLVESPIESSASSSSHISQLLEAPDITVPRRKPKPSQRKSARELLDALDSKLTNLDNKVNSISDRQIAMQRRTEECYTNPRSGRRTLYALRNQQRLLEDIQRTVNIILLQTASRSSTTTVQSSPPFYYDPYYTPDNFPDRYTTQNM